LLRRKKGVAMRLREVARGDTAGSDGLQEIELDVGTIVLSLGISRLDARDLGGRRSLMGPIHDRPYRSLASLHHSLHAAVKAVPYPTGAALPDCLPSQSVAEAHALNTPSNAQLAGEFHDVILPLFAFPSRWTFPGAERFCPPW
jgi:hypothetical protein